MDKVRHIHYQNNFLKNHLINFYFAHTFYQNGEAKFELKHVTIYYKVVNDLKDKKKTCFELKWKEYDLKKKKLIQIWETFSRRKRHKYIYKFLYSFAKGKDSL